jgi:hypothetical protein
VQSFRDPLAIVAQSYYNRCTIATLSITITLIASQLLCIHFAIFLCNPFAIAPHPLRARCEISAKSFAIQSICNHSATAALSLRYRCDVTLHSLRNRSAIVAESLRIHFAIALQSRHNRFAIALQSRRNRFAIIKR